MVMHTKKAQELYKLFYWALNKFLENNPDENLCFYDISHILEDVWFDMFPEIKKP